MLDVKCLIPNKTILLVLCFKLQALNFNLVWYLVPEAFDCFYYCLTQFFSKIGNVDIEFRIFFKNLIIASNLFYNFCPRDTPSFTFQKICQYLKFFQGCLDFLIILEYFFLASIETNSFMLQNISRRNPLYYSSNSCIEFFEIKRFNDIIICSTGKSFQFIIKFSFGSCHKNRGGGMFFSNMFTEFYTIHSWEHDIQNDNIKLMMLHDFQSI